MRKIVALMCLAILLPTALIAQQQDTAPASLLPVDSEGNIVWQGVVNVKNADKDSLYVKAIAWINKTFPNPSSVTSVRSIESGKIEGNHNIRLTDDHKGTKVPSKTVGYKFKLELRDGRFRYTFYEFNLKTASKYPLERWIDPKGPFYSADNKDYLMQIKTFVEELIESMTEFMVKPGKEAEEDW